MNSKRRLLICDLDNTLYDWVGYFVPAFYAMIDAVVEITRCNREQLLDDFRLIHQKHGDCEQPFALLETETVREIYSGVPRSEVAEILDAAFHAFNSSRRKNLKLYPTVRESLDSLVATDIRLIAHTESKLYGVLDRLNRLDLFRYFSKIYCRERSPSSHPQADVGSRWLDKFPMDKVVELSHHQRKPNPEVLIEICDAEGIAPDDAAYIGDSIARDVMMAKNAKVFAIWAAYGSKHDPETYRALVRVSHWTEDEVVREKRLSDQAKNIAPDFTADAFADALACLKEKWIGASKVA